MTCQSCGHINREGAGFCASCGTALTEAACPSCGTANPVDSSFCDSCGHKLAEPTPAPRDYTPEHLAEKILRDRAGLEGERRTATVLFADAVGSTPLAERIDPEDVYSMMQGCVQRMMDAVHRHEGTVTQFRGDGIMALFGAPIAHEDSARRAVAAALEMQDSLKEYADEIHARGGRWAKATCRFRVGLNTGLVVVGSIGDDLVMDVTAVGDTSNLAARMEAAAEPGTVYLTEATYRAVRDYVQCEPVGALTVKGKREPVPAYRALRDHGIRTRMEAAVSRGLTPYVGREEELSFLRQNLTRSISGQGQVILVSGEAGSGKSRLLLEFRRSVGDEARWIEGQSMSHGHQIPYLPLIGLIKSAFGIEETDDEGRMIERIDATVATWLPEAQKTVPYLKFLLQLDPGDASVARMDPLERRAGILGGVRALVLQESLRGSLVVVVEDLHWTDGPTAEALAALADAVADAPVLMVLTYRPGYAHGLGELPHAHRLALGPLPEGESQELAGHVLQSASLPNDLFRSILAKAEGNPFFIEEVTKALVERGALRQSGDGLVVQGAVDDIEVPNTIQDVILSRIDRLEREAKEALQLASVIGREFTARLLRGISNSEEAVSGVLSELRGLELIYEKAYFPEVAYMFKHALTHDVAYSTLLLERRRLLHRAVAEAIEELYADRISEHAETLAYHFLVAEAWEKALEYLIKAAEKSTAAYANNEALSFYAQAFDVAQRLGRDTEAANIALQSGILTQGIGLYPRSIEELNRAIDRARAAQSRRIEGLALAWRATTELLAHEFETSGDTAAAAAKIADEGHDEVRCLVDLTLGVRGGTLGDIEVGRKHTESAVASATRLGNNPELSMASTELAVMQNWTAEYDAALRTMDDTDAAVEQAGSVFWTAGRLWVRALTLGGKGCFEQSMAFLNEAIDLGERTGEIFFRIRSLNTLGWLFGELHDHDRAREWNERSLESALAAGFPDPEIEFNARLNLADGLLALGRIDEAGEQLEIVEAVVRDPRPYDRWALWTYSQHLFATAGEVALESGDTEAALAYASECIDLARSTHRPKNLVKGHRLRARALAAKGDLEGAQTEIETALAIAERIGNPPQLWISYAALGDIKVVQGDRRAAHGAYRGAVKVIDGIAGGLHDTSLREVFVNSPALERVRGAVAATT